ncbi:hypothetical protein NDU88_007598 [Pleurodeles waltl]|uniref:Uncharacterized protein n=1 Tax=Pleurodeles waltl TaxID=8319 RepID=A0AAV7PPR9_PLEWA|nr:hypothetical protein NDU88_007598 [Pleurodeles waltl]
MKKDGSSAECGYIDRSSSRPHTRGSENQKRNRRCEAVHVAQDGQDRTVTETRSGGPRPYETEIAARPSEQKKRQIFGRVWLYRSELLTATHSWLGEPEEESAVRGSTRGPGRAGSDCRRNSERRPEVRSAVDTLRSRGPMGPEP